MKTHLYNKPQFNSEFVTTVIGRYFDDPDDGSTRATFERILAWIAQTITECKIGRKHGDTSCECIAEKIASRLLANRYLLKNRKLMALYHKNDREGVLRVLFAVCGTAADQHIREFSRRRIADHIGEEISITGALADGSVPEALTHQPSAVSMEFEVNEIVTRLPIDQQEIVRSALLGLTQREIAEKLGITLARVNRKINASLPKSDQEPQL